MSITLMLGGGLALLAGAVWVLFRTFGHRGKDDLGSISDSWVAQHRASSHEAPR
jgi:hypothetical protein